MALLLVLVVVALLTSLLTDLAFSTLVDLRLTETFRDGTKAYYLAKGGINAGRMILQNDKNDFDSDKEIWGMGIVNFPVGDGFVSVQIEDQGGRLSLNDMVKGDNPQAVMIDRFYRFLLAMDLGADVDPAELTAALVDWLDENDEPYAEIRTDGLNIPVAGAEEIYYRSQSPAYSCRNGAIETLQEMTLIKGFTPELVEKIRPHLTAYGTQKININTASAEVLMSLDSQVERETAERIIEFRDQEPIKTIDQLEPILTTEIYSALKAQALTEPQQLGTTSETYRIESVAMINDGQRKVEGLVDKIGNRLLFIKVN
ncbi:MAG: type II secretion system minor pseudopilin GspK [Desulfuromonadales bacterium]